MSFQKSIRVLMPMHTGFDVMDFFGPLEILSLAQKPASAKESTTMSDASSSAFEVVVAGEEFLTITEPGVKVANNISLKEAYKSLADFDVLVIPGGNSAGILKTKAEPIHIIKAFAALPARSSSPRVIMSVCTGALFLASAGVLKGQYVTTNSQHLDRLRLLISAVETTIVERPQRFVINPVGGLEGKGLQGYQMITCGGPGVGLDLSMWLVEHYFGEEVRTQVEDLMEYNGRLSEGLVID